MQEDLDLNLRKNNSGLARQNEEFENKNKKLNEDLAQIKNEKNEQQITLENLNIQLSKAQNQLNDITKERDGLKKREEELILKLTEATKNCESFAQKISNL